MADLDQLDKEKHLKNYLAGIFSRAAPTYDQIGPH